MLNLNSKKVVIYMGKGIGDCLILSELISSLRSVGYKVSVITEPKCAFIFDSLIEVDGVILKKNKINLTGYDIFIDPYDNAHEIAAKIRLILNSDFSYTIGFNTHIYDKNITYTEYRSHFSSRFKYIEEELHYNSNIKCIQLKPDADIEYEITEWVSKTLGKKKLVVLCPFASNEVRNLSPTQCSDILNHINKNEKYITIILGSTEQLSNLPSSLNNHFITDPFGTFDSAITLVKNAEFVISVDTVFVHISSFYDKKLFAIYNNRVIDKAFENNFVFSPNYSNATVIFTDDGFNSTEGGKVSRMNISKLLSKVDHYIYNSK
ncbi:glycosyltransferase family 9 protein [Dryocola clanedunensis]|uniref:glycosyltransferase family 9 protein n=1 Tax=Cedecea sulfonylureivorans TaxID=3051154 RepID=UPI0019268B1B|nr:glycosyltransferase family 9 protein [Cedecea sulfonylureivorans]